MIAPSVLTDFAPLYCDDSGGNVVTQFDKDDVEAAGLVKFEDIDNASHTARVKAQGTDAKGRGGANAAASFRLEPAEYDALVLAATVELDARVGRVVAYLNDHTGHARPTIGLALALAEASNAGDGSSTSPFAFAASGAVRDGLLILEGSGPLPAREIRVSAAIAAR